MHLNTRETQEEAMRAYIKGEATPEQITMVEEGIAPSYRTDPTCGLCPYAGTCSKIHAEQQRLYENNIPRMPEVTSSRN